MSNKKRGALSQAEKDHIAECKEWGCGVREKAELIGDYCEGELEYNHLSTCGKREGSYRGHVVCAKHHRWGKISIHRAKETFNKTYGTQEELIADIWEKVGYEPF